MNTYNGSVETKYKMVRRDFATDCVIKYMVSYCMSKLIRL